jgi:glycosyltransferase involved in cell wall biosynthesis
MLEQNMLRLSLVIATYNRAAQLCITLESVVAQTAPTDLWECIVVDNRSTDDTAERVAQFCEVHPQVRIRYVREEHQGLSWARNRGITESQGVVIAIIDDDERIAPEFVTSYIDFFEQHPTVASAGGPIVAEYLSARPQWMSFLPERAIANPIDLGNKERPFPKGRIPGGGNMALQRWCVERHGLFDTQLGRRGKQLLGGEESDLFARLQRAGESCWYVPGAVMYHRIPDTKLTQAYFEKLCYNIGISQRARWRGSRVMLGVCEGLKWGATLLLATGYLLCGRCAKAQWLIRMRRCITRGMVLGK